jgi:hypothetical protein
VLSRSLNIAQLLPATMMLLRQPTEKSEFGSPRQRAEGLVSMRTDIFDTIRGNKTSGTVSN